VSSHTLRPHNRSNGPRFVLGSTRLAIAVLITGLGCAGILLAQRGIFALFGGSYQTAWMPGVMGLGLMCAAFVVARYRNDLVDD
jgi:hypothetical protein